MNVINTLNYWSPVPNSASSSERSWTKRSKIIHADRTNYYVLNSIVHWTESYQIARRCTEMIAN